MEKKLITISRQCGSGGHTIGEKVSERLGIPLYDKKIMELVAERSGLSLKTVREQGEYASRSLLYSIATLVSKSYSVDMDNRGKMALPDQINAYQVEVIRELAGQGSGIFIGKCADSILEDDPDCLHVYISGDLEDRKKRVTAEHGIPPEEAEAHVLDRDKKRATHYRYFTDRVWGTASNYDLCLNSSFWGIDGCVDIIAGWFEK